MLIVGGVLTDGSRLSAVQRAAAVAAAPDTGLRRVTATAARELGVDFAFLSLVDDVEEQLLAVQRSDGGPVPGSLPVEQSLCRYLVEFGRPLYVDDLEHDPDLTHLVEMRALGLRAYAGTPITDRGGAVLGGLCVGHGAARSWSGPERLLLADLASSVSTELALRVALDDISRLERQARRHAREQQALQRVATAVARGGEPDAVLGLVAEELVRILPVSAALVLRFEASGRAVAVATAGTGPVPEVESCAHTLARVRGGDDAAVGTDDESGCAAVPVLLHGRTWGAIVVTAAPADSGEVVPQLQELADAIALVVDSADARERLAHLAATDPLTGVPNRRTFEARLREELARGLRHGHPLTLALIDVDAFKPVNDEWGHERGDRLLEELAHRLQVLLRTGDLLARIGGDEFALVLPETDERAAQDVLDRLRRAVADTSLAGLATTVTVGAAVTDDCTAGTSALYRAADRALYAGKARGRDAVEVIRVD